MSGDDVRGEGLKRRVSWVSITFSAKEREMRKELPASAFSSVMMVYASLKLLSSLK